MSGVTIPLQRRYIWIGSIRLLGKGENFRSNRGMLDCCEDRRREAPRNVRSETDLNFGEEIK